jgi:hypothetical protein
MQLIPTDILSKIPDLYETCENQNPICQVKLFIPLKIENIQFK